MTATRFGCCIIADENGQPESELVQGRDKHPGFGEHTEQKG